MISPKSFPQKPIFFFLLSLLLSLLFISACPKLRAAWKVFERLPSFPNFPTSQNFQNFQNFQNSNVQNSNFRAKIRRMLISSNESVPRHHPLDGWPDEEDQAMFTRAREVEEERKREERKEEEEREGGGGKKGEKRRKKVALMFLTRGPMPHDLLWEKWLKGHEDLFTVYIHSSTLGFKYNANTTKATVFYGRDIPNIQVKWGTLALLRAERRLLATALADKENDRFVLLSEKCVPLWPATYVHEYLMEAETSYFGSYGTTFRWVKEFLPEIRQDQWRKGSQWFAIIRDHALAVINDKVVYEVLLARHHDKTLDESYIQTLIPMVDPARFENRPVTYVKWQQVYTCHPYTFRKEEISVETFDELRSLNVSMPEGLQRLWSERIPCKVNGKFRHCYLFARKFADHDTPKLLEVAEKLSLIKEQK